MKGSIYLENQNLRINELRLKNRIEELETKVNELEQQLLIQRVSQQRELLEAYTKQIKEDNELTEEVNFQDINKCLASNCG